MARPIKVRRISALPETYRQEGPPVTIGYDEFECIRLIDLCGLSNAAYRRPDGVCVVPLTALKN